MTPSSVGSRQRTALTTYVTPAVLSKASLCGPQVLKGLIALPRDLVERPGAAGVNLEPYVHSRDRRFRTARVTDAYRALIWLLDEHTALVWDVATHDEADRASRRCQVKVDALTGAIRVTEVSQEAEPAALEQPIPNTELFDRSSAIHLLKQLEVPTDPASVICLARTEDDLEVVARVLPQYQRAVLAVAELAAGRSPEDAYAQAVALAPDGAVAIDISTALLKSTARGELQVLRAESELVKALERPWDHWMTYLHPTQRKLAYRHSFSGPAKVVGGPGTGKTVVAVHRVKHLLDRGVADLFDAPKPILLTTFMRSTAHDLERLIGALMPSIEPGRLQVRNIDTLVRELLALHEYQSRGFKILDSGAVAKRLSTMLQARDIGVDPVRAVTVWENVVLGAEVPPSWEEAVRDRKRESLGGLSEKTWTPFLSAVDELTDSLWQDESTTYLLRTRELLRLLPEDSVGFSHVVVDEAQDLHAAHWRLLRRLVSSGPDDIFLVGDADQRLYRSAYPLSRAGIRTAGRSHRLTVAYRSSQDILDFSTTLLAGVPTDALDGESSERQAPTSVFSSTTPELFGFADVNAEQVGVAAIVGKWLSQGLTPEEMLIATPSYTSCKQMVGALEQASISAVHVQAEVLSQVGEVPVATYHRCKGREAKAVIVTGASSHYWSAEDSDPASRVNRLLPLYVACTRARQRLVITWAGKPSDLLMPVRG